MTDRTTQDPFVECFFDVEFTYSGGTVSTYFKGLSGGEMEITLIQHDVVYQNGGSTTLFIPGASSYSPITLYQGVTDDKFFWNWWADVTKGKRTRCNATITAYGHITEDGGDQKMAEWTLENVWPLSISGFNFDLDSEDPFIAEVTLVAESIERTS